MLNSITCQQIEQQAIQAAYARLTPRQDFGIRTGIFSMVLGPSILGGLELLASFCFPHFLSMFAVTLLSAFLHAFTNLISFLTIPARLVLIRKLGISDFNLTSVLLLTPRQFASRGVAI